MAQKIDIIRGDYRNIEVTFRKSDGSAYDLTGGTVFFTVNSSQDPSDDTGAEIQKDVSSHSNPTEGKTTISLTSSDTEIDPGTYYYDIQLKDSAGNIVSAEKAKFEITSDITRRTS